MTESRVNRLWTMVIILLIVIIVVGAIFIRSKYNPSQAVEISIPPHPEIEGKIYVSGAVQNPGAYLFTKQDSIESLLQTAGGTTGNATLDRLKLYIPETGVILEPQKIDINRAEVWLLEALPEIGETLAKRIVDYRQQNGPFQNIRDITRVAGIDTATYEKIKHLITVAD